MHPENLGTVASQRHSVTEPSGKRPLRDASRDASGSVHAEASRRKAHNDGTRDAVTLVTLLFAPCWDIRRPGRRMKGVIHVSIGVPPMQAEGTQESQRLSSILRPSSVHQYSTGHARFVHGSHTVCSRYRVVRPLQQTRDGHALPLPRGCHRASMAHRHIDSMTLLCYNASEEVDSMVRLSLRLPDELHEKLRWAAFKERRSQQVMVLEILEKALAKVEVPEEARR